jgi:hypothetical protein
MKKQFLCNIILAGTLCLSSQNLYAATTEGLENSKLVYVLARTSGKEIDSIAVKMMDVEMSPENPLSIKQVRAYCDKLVRMGTMSEMLESYIGKDANVMGKMGASIGPILASFKLYSENQDNTLFVCYRYNWLKTAYIDVGNNLMALYGLKSSQLVFPTLDNICTMCTGEEIDMFGTDYKKHNFSNTDIKEKLKTLVFWDEDSVDQIAKEADMLDAEGNMKKGFTLNTVLLNDALQRSLEKTLDARLEKVKKNPMQLEFWKLCVSKVIEHGGDLVPSWVLELKTRLDGDSVTAGVGLGSGVGSSASAVSAPAAGAGGSV